ncbi:MAG: proteasome accessory factor PafA2 [Acidimicrobiaceae bacterium]|nr:proteasome accessory factor PafA2 [Acidimicrobiaceae bacterium]
MAVEKICGIETEYSIIHKGVSDPNPILASSMLITSYVQESPSNFDNGIADSVVWDFQDEMPSNDARGFTPIGSLPPIVETHLVNAVLTNGARFYVDHAHPEMSTPECPNALEVARYDRSGELILKEAMKAVNALLPEDQEIVVYKDNSDGKGNSYGCHENYLMDRNTPFGDIISHGIAHFITRQIFTGSGKIGCEVPGSDPDSIQYQITQRADFFEEEVGLETTLKRPIINTRDEPHSDADRYRRLHVICGDANMSEVATFLKVGSTCFVLAMIEDGFIKEDFIFENPVQSMKEISYDLTLSQPILRNTGESITALEVQQYLFERAKEYALIGGNEYVGGTIGEQILEKWEEILIGLENDPDSLHSQIDWIAKKRLLDVFCDRHNLSYFDAKSRSLAVQYHDLREDSSVFNKLGMKYYSDNEEVSRGVSQPPEGTRAYFRGRCLQKWPEQIVSANWDSVVFSLDDTTIRRIPVLDPLKGTYNDVAEIIEECATPHELIHALDI